MTAEQTTHSLLVIIITGIVILSGLLFMLALSGRLLTDDANRSRLGTALGHTVGALGVFLIALTPFFVNRMMQGPGLGNPLPGAWGSTSIRSVLAISIVWAMTGALIALPALVRRFREDPYEISNEGVFGTLAQAMPIIVADSTGIIQHTTPAFNELARASPGEMVGRDLKTIMPERYRGQHDGGMDHYVRTREARIVGTVVTVEMLRLDGTEIPVYLALNTTDVDGLPWFIAALWEKVPETPSTMITAFERSREDRQDERDLRQDEQQVILDQTSLTNTQRGKYLSEAEVTLDERRVGMDAEQSDMDKRERDVTEREGRQP